jgi:hypothetical protein
MSGARRWIGVPGYNTLNDRASHHELPTSSLMVACQMAIKNNEQMTRPIIIMTTFSLHQARAYHEPVALCFSPFASFASAMPSDADKASCLAVRNCPSALAGLS